MSIQELAQTTYENHHGSIVSVLTRTPELGRGSGFIIRSTDTWCLVMTCEHVVQGIDLSNSNHTLSVRLAGDTAEYAANVVYACERSDIAVIIARGMTRKHPSMQFGDVVSMAPLTDVFLLAYTRANDLKGTSPVLNVYPSISPGKITSPPLARQGRMDLCYSLSVKMGTSGGALVWDGKVRGVHYQCDYQINYARSSETVKSVLGKWVSVAQDSTLTIEEMIEMIQIDAEI